MSFLAFHLLCSSCSVLLKPEINQCSFTKIYNLYSVVKLFKRIYANFENIRLTELIELFVNKVKKTFFFVNCKY